MDNLRASLELQWANNSGSALANCDHYGFVKRCALARPMEMRGLSVRQKAPRMAVVITPGASGKSSETRSDLFPRSALFSYERCQATFGRLFGRTVVDYIRWALGGGRLFLTAPLTPMGSEAMGVRSEKSARVIAVEPLWNASPSRDWAEQFYFSFQTPIRASEFIKRSDNLTYSSA